MSESARSSVLVVHDDPGGPDCPVDSLRNQYDVAIATDREEAIESLHDDLDVAILDTTATGEIDLAERIRRARIDCQVAMFDDVGAEPGVQSDVDVLVPKPLDSSELQRTVEQLCAFAAYKETKRTLSSLRVRRNVRRTELSTAERKANTAYQDLCERIEFLEDELGDLLETIDDPDLLEALED